jgi:protein-S-isoprenylcysteine O-methyltransferase Ste14
MHPAGVLMSLWGAFVLSWLLAAFWSRRVQKRAEFGGALPYRLVTLAGGALLFVRSHGYEGPLRLWTPTLTAAWICVGLVALGFAFAWWARLWLGSLWSGSVTLKEGHHIVDTGPYAIVRHPIYTGLLLSTYATMGAKGTMTAVAGVVVITIGVWMKARIEERWLSQELGADEYTAYRRRVPMLLPFGPK